MLNKMGLYPPVWGRHQWAMLHLMAEVYPDKPSLERQADMLKYLKGMCANLPCPGCSKHCKAYTTNNIPDVTSRESVIKYFIDFHNAVNKQTGKKELTYQEAKDTIRNNFYKVEDWTALQQASASKKELEDLKRSFRSDTLLKDGKDGKSVKESNGDSDTLIIVSVILGLLIFIILFVLVVYYLKTRA